MAVSTYNPGPNRAQRRGTHFAQKHMSKPGSKGRASWNWQKGAFGQVSWRRTSKEVAVPAVPEAV